MRKQLDNTQEVFIEMKAYLYARFDCTNKQQLEEFVQYVQNNVVARRMKIEYGTPTYIILNEQENEYKFVHENINVPVHLTQIEQDFPVKDFTIPFYLHILPKTNQIVLIFNHMIADARFIFNLITGFTQKQPFQQELFDSPCVLLKNQIQQHQPVTKYVESNSFKIPELPNKLNCYICRVTNKIEDVLFMKQNHTQRMALISGLLKLRLLQKEGLMSYDDIMNWMGTGGINTFLIVVMDARCLVKNFKANCGNFISFYRNSYKLLKNTTVGELVQKLREQLADLTNQQQYLEELGGVNPYNGKGMLEGIILSSFGNLKTPFKKVNIKQHAYDDKNPGVLFLYSYTIDDYLTVTFQYNDQQVPYFNELRMWLTNLVQNCKNDMTIEQLYKLLQ